MSDYYLLDISCAPGGVCKSHSYFFNNIQQIKEALLDDINESPISGIYIPLWYGETINLEIHIKDAPTKIIDLQQYLSYEIEGIPGSIKYNSKKSEYILSSSNISDRNTRLDDYMDYIEELTWNNEYESEITSLSQDENYVIKFDIDNVIANVYLEWPGIPGLPNPISQKEPNYGFNDYSYKNYLKPFLI